MQSLGQGLTVNLPRKSMSKSIQLLLNRIQVGVTFTSVQVNRPSTGILGSEQTES